jgi:putative transposase
MKLMSYTKRVIKSTWISQRHYPKALAYGRLFRVVVDPKASAFLFAICPAHPVTAESQGQAAFRRPKKPRNERGWINIAMNRAHKIRLEPNNKQTTFFKKSCGCARWTYNFALAQWNDWHEQGGKPSGNELLRYFNSIKKDQFPWVMEVSKCSTARPFLDLDTAFQRFFKGVSKHPKFHKKGENDAFFVDGTAIKLDGNRLRLPKIGWIKMSEELRFKDAKICNVVVSPDGGHWYAAINCELPDSPKVESQDGQVVGVDMGIKHLMTLSDGTVYEPLDLAKRFDKKIRREQKSLARKQPGSRSREKARQRLNKTYFRIRSVKQDYLHKITHELAETGNVFVMEHLDIQGMAQKSFLAKSIYEMSWYEIRRQLTYKGNVLLAEGDFPSSQKCSVCGKVKTDLKLSNRVYRCECGAVLDRDMNAALNLCSYGLEKLGMGSPEVKPVELEALAVIRGGETADGEAGIKQQAL